MKPASRRTVFLLLILSAGSLSWRVQDADQAKRREGFGAIKQAEKALKQEGTTSDQANYPLWFAEQLQKKASELAEASRELENRLKNPYQMEADTPELAKRCEKLSKEIRNLLKSLAPRP